MTIPIQPTFNHSLPTSTSKPIDQSIESARNRLVSQASNRHADNTELREAFDDFVGQTFFGQMLSSMRKTVGKPAYFHGGRTEEIFQAQLDQTLAEKLSDASANSFTDPMFDLFTRQR